MKKKFFLFFFENFIDLNPILGRVWICETSHPDASIKMQQVALKLYRYPETVS